MGEEDQDFKNSLDSMVSDQPGPRETLSQCHPSHHQKQKRKPKEKRKKKKSSKIKVSLVEGEEVKKLMYKIFTGQEQNREYKGRR